MDWHRAHDLISQAVHHLSSENSDSIEHIADSIERIDVLLHEVDQLDDFQIPSGLYGYLSPIRALLWEAAEKFQAENRESTFNYKQFVASMPQNIRHEIVNMIFEIYDLSYKQTRR